MKSLTHQAVHSIIGLLFVISGGLGLTYQIVWFKYLSLFLGNATFAQTIVLATFMGGLAIGSARWGRKSDQTVQPLRLYALLELGIGVYCLIYPKFLELLKNAFIGIIVSLQLPSDGTAVLISKLLISFCTLLFPTILMGGTLPILVRSLSRQLEESGRNIAVLYFLNSFGAIVGSFLAGFFLIRILGLSTTIFSAAIINILLGGFALWLSLQKISIKTVNVKGSKKQESKFTHREVILASSVAGISGIAAMIYEVCWVRLLIPLLGSSTYSFSLMLVAFIAGITIGSFIVSMLIQRIKNLPALLAWCQVGIVLSLLATLPVYARLPYEIWKMTSLLIHDEATYPIFLTIQFAFGFTLMIVPTIFLGMSLPIASRIATRSINVLGKSVGNVFAINTLGTVCGSLLAGLVLIPLIGVRHTIEVGIGCNLLAAMFVFRFSNIVSPRQILIGIPVMFLALTMYFLFSPNWSQGAMLSGVFRRINWNIKPPKNYSEFTRYVNSANVVYYKEGTTATVGVIEEVSSTNTQRTLIINGKSDASSKGDLPTQVLLGQIPCLLHQKPQVALVIGLGSGVTLGSMLTHSLTHVDCVEISPEVVEASSQFNDVNYKPLSDPRTKLFVEDALAFLKLTQQKYDIIVSEPSNPWIAGVGNLYTTEFFETCKHRMNPGGMMVQWFHLYEMNDDIFKMVVRTFRKSFSHISIWQPLVNDVIMIGSEQPLSIDFNRMQTIMSTKGVKEDLQRILISDAATFLSLEMLSSQSLAYFVSVGELNTEDHPRLEYGAPSASFVDRGADQLIRFDERLNSASVTLLLKKKMEIEPLTDNELRNIGLFHSIRSQNNTLFGYSVLLEYLRRHPKDIAVLERVAEIAELAKHTDDALGFRKILMELEPKDPNAIEKYAWLKYLHDHASSTALMPFETREYEQLLQKSIDLVADTVDRYRVRLADMYYGTHQYAKARDQFERTVQIRDKHEGDPNIHDDILLLQMAHCFHYLDENNRAVSCAMQSIRINPENEEAKDLVYEIWMGGALKTTSK